MVKSVTSPESNWAKTEAKHSKNTQEVKTWQSIFREETLVMFISPRPHISSENLMYDCCCEFL